MTTISDNDRITGPLQPPAGSTQLSTDFPVFDSDDVVVLRRVGGGDWVRLSLGVNYTVSNLEQDAGAVINLQQPVQAGEEYLLIGSMLPQPGLEQVYGERISSTEINRELGRLWAAIQELKRASGQRDEPGAQPLMLPAGEKETLPSAPQRAGLLLEFDDDGKPITRFAINSLGDVKTINLRGNWEISKNYNPLDVVYYNGSSYIAYAAHTSDAKTEPEIGTDWQTVWNVLVYGGVAVGSITTDKLADGAVTAAKLSSDAQKFSVRPGIQFVGTGRYTAFSRLVAAPGKTFLVAYDGPAHLNSVGKVVVWEADQEASVWSATPRTVFEHATLDVRGVAAGYAADKLFVAYCLMDWNTSIIQGMFVAISGDGGNTWSHVQVSADQWFPYGQIIEVDGTLILPCYGGGYTAAIFKSTDGGQSWTGPKLIQPTLSYISETSVEYIGANTLIAISRTEPGGGATYLTFKSFVSTDMGETWSYIGEISGDTWNAGTPPDVKKINGDTLLLTYRQRDLGVLRYRIASVSEAVLSGSVWSTPSDLEGGFTVGAGGYTSVLTSSDDERNVIIAHYQEFSATNSSIRIVNFRLPDILYLKNVTAQSFSFNAHGSGTKGEIRSRVGGLDNIGYISSSSSPFVFYGTNVGVGTLTPRVSLDVNGAIGIGRYFSSSGLPDATNKNGCLIFVNDKLAYSDGTNWRFVDGGVLV